jgi:hypothetical protein
MAIHGTTPTVLTAVARLAGLRASFVCGAIARAICHDRRPEHEILHGLPDRGELGERELRRETRRDDQCSR